jgi:hypothetical protein
MVAFFIFTQRRGDATKVLRDLRCIHICEISGKQNYIRSGTLIPNIAIEAAITFDVISEI